MFKSNSLCKSEKLVVFFWCRQDQKGTGCADIHTITPGKLEGVFFMFKSNSLCKSENLWCFSGVDRTRRELVALINIR